MKSPCNKVDFKIWRSIAQSESEELSDKVTTSILRELKASKPPSERPREAVAVVSILAGSGKRSVVMMLRNSGNDLLFLLLGDGGSCLDYIAAW